MIEKILAYALVGGAVLLTPISLHASGSGGGGGGGYGGGGYGGASYPSSSTPRDPYAESYARGQSQFKKHIICKKCQYSQGVHESVTASEVAKRVKAGEFQLTQQQRADMMIFLQNRYGVKV